MDKGNILGCLLVVFFHLRLSSAFPVDRACGTTNAIALRGAVRQWVSLAPFSHSFVQTSLVYDFRIDAVDECFTEKTANDFLEKSPSHHCSWSEVIVL